MRASTRTDVVPADLYSRLLGAAWSTLDPVIRRAHVARGATGHFTFRYGTGMTARLLRRVMRWPSADQPHATRLVIVRDQRGERWERAFGGRRLVTRQRALPDGHLAERLGVVELRFQLRGDAGTLRFVSTGAALALAGCRVPLPRWLAPRVDAHETPGERTETTHVRLTVSLPLAGLLMTYEGDVRADEAV